MSLPKGKAKATVSTNDIMKTPFLMFQSHYDDYYDMSKDSLRGLQEQTILSKVFFSPENVEILQKRIIASVFYRTNGQFLIEKQEESDLQVVMRSMFIQHARHWPDDIPKQIHELNNFVVDDVVPGIISQVRAYDGYLERAFGPRQILDRPENVSNAGQKTLPSVTRTFDSNNLH